MWSALYMAALLLLQAPDYNAEGIRALEAEHYDEATVAFEKALEADPEDYSAQFHLGLIYSLTGRMDEAIEAYEDVLSIKPDLYEALLNLGISLLDADRAEDAVKPLTEAVEQRAEEFRPNFYLAESLWESGAYAQAESRYRKALELNSEDAASEFGLGQSIAAQGRLQEAEDHYRKAAELDPEYRDGLRDLAARYEKAEAYSEAINIYREFPEDAAVQERMGELLLALERNGEAIASLERAVEASPTAANRYALAVGYIREKQFSRAEPLMRLALEEEPGNTDLRMAYGRVLRDQRKYALAAGEFQRVTELDPEGHEAWSELASMLILLEDYPRAVEALDRAQELGEDSTGVYYFRALAYDHQQDYKPALENYQRFLELSVGVLPDEEFLARQRIRVILRELGKR